MIKDTTNSYTIRGGIVKFNEYKKFIFEVINPFFIRERFFNINVNQCLISIKIKNITDKNLTLTDLKLNPKAKPDMIKLVKSLEEIKNNGQKNENDSKYLTLKPKEKLLVLFKIEDPDLFYDNMKFTCSFHFNTTRYRMTLKLRYYYIFFFFIIFIKI